MAKSSEEPIPETVENMVASLKAQVTAAREEFDLALVFHSIWKPAAYDEDLHRRMGPSFASNAFLVVRTALQREMLMALTRLWDSSRKAVRLASIRNILMDERVIKALARRSTADASPVDEVIANITPWLQSQFEVSLAAQAKDAIALIDAYISSDLERRVALANLKFLRDKVLAHRQVKQVDIPEKTATSDQIEHFMSDMTKLISLLSSIAHATAYDPKDTAQIYDYYAELFWQPARGERSEGHPRYCPPPS